MVDGEKMQFGKWVMGKPLYFIVFFVIIIFYLTLLLILPSGGISFFVLIVISEQINQIYGLWIEDSTSQNIIYYFM